MTPNDALAAEYRDLLEDDASDTDAAGLLPVIAALDALYAAPVPPALQEHLAQATHHAAGTMLTLDDEVWAPSQASTGPTSRRSSPAGFRSRVRPTRRWQGFGALAAAVVVVALMATVLHALAPTGMGSIGGETPSQRFARLGGTRIVLSDAAWYFPPPGFTVNSRAIFHAEEPLLSHRFAYGMGVGDAIFSQPDKDHLVIELPGVGQQQWTEVRALLAPGQVDAYVSVTELPVGTQGEGTVPVVQAFTGSDVDPASVAEQTDPQSGQPIVVLALKPALRAAFAQLTARHIGDYLIVFLDSTVIESATLQSQIDGSFELVGFPSTQDAGNIATFLKYGSTQPGGIQSMTYVAPQR